MELRIGTSGWNYPAGRGTWNGIFYPAPGDRQPGLRRAPLLRRALQHRRGEQHVLRAAAAHRQPGLGPADAAGLRVLGEAVPEVHPSGHRPGHDAGVGGATSTRSGPASSRSPRRASSARSWRSSRRGFTTRRRRATTCEWLLRTFARLSRWRWNCAIDRGATPPADTHGAARRGRRRLGADRRAEVRIVDPPGRCGRTRRSDLPAAARPERRAVVDPRAVRGSLQLPVFGERAPADRRQAAGGARAGARSSIST